MFSSKSVCGRDCVPPAMPYELYDKAAQEPRPSKVPPFQRMAVPNTIAAPNKLPTQLLDARLNRVGYDYNMVRPLYAFVLGTIVLL